MKRLFGTLFLTITLFGTADAQLLYRISGNGLTRASYIVGTYHLAPASFVDDIKGAREAMAAVEQVYGEMNMQDMAEVQQLILSAMMLPEDKHIGDLFTDQEMTRINAYMRSVVGADFTNPLITNQMGRMRPSVLATQLMLLQCMKLTPELNPTSLIDEYFQKEARKMGKRVGGFESAAFQIELLYGSKSIAEERDELLELVDNNAEALAEMQAMTEAYFALDINALGRIMRDEVESGDMTLEEFKTMVTDRNRRWVESMPDIMLTAPTLFVVGAGHLAGNEGVITLLQSAGYNVEAVE